MPDRALSGLVVAVPEADPVVGALRDRLDEHAALGVPAHVTALLPLAPTGEIDDDVLRRVADVVAAAEPFGYRFSRTAWFGSDVVWLAPHDPEPFRELTRRLRRWSRRAAFPLRSGAQPPVIVSTSS